VECYPAEITSRQRKESPREHTLPSTTAVLPKIPHSNCCKRVPNRPLRGRRGRFGTILQLLECGIFGRTAVRLRPASQNAGTRAARRIAGCRTGASDSLRCRPLPIRSVSTNGEGVCPRSSMKDDRMLDALLVCRLWRSSAPEQYERSSLMQRSGLPVGAAWRALNVEPVVVVSAIPRGMRAGACF